MRPADTHPNPAPPTPRRRLFVVLLTVYLLWLSLMLLMWAFA